MIDLTSAERLLNFAARIDEHRAQEQLEGAVALHNILKRYGVAYLADEVGMGKTYVALGAMALFRHFNPNFRLLILAPRENIQDKWMKELKNFTANNIRYPDLRCTTIDHRPARALVKCQNLLDFANQAVTDPNRDFFMRLSSFSLPLANDPKGWAIKRDELKQTLPWFNNEVFDLRNKGNFKENFAKAICCAMPVFDLVIVDEGHNLKHGFSERVSARNQGLALSFGHPSIPRNERLFPVYGPRAKMVLFLSATPLEESYHHIWNQLDIFGKGRVDNFADLLRGDLSEEEKKKIVAKFLVRRVTSVKVNGKEMTKNQYRREWRRGGVHLYDEPICIEDDRQRLIVALVQKKVAELLGSEKFNNSFQIGMLASFESFLQTAKLKRDEEASETTFDDTEQTENAEEREGIDVHDLNRMSKNYRECFGEEMPHPKMDAVVESLANSWVSGKKSLIFVRRVASVKELKKKLDERYDDWLIDTLRKRLPSGVTAQFNEIVEKYRKLKKVSSESWNSSAPNGEQLLGGCPQQDDKGGSDTFFAWFFRGEGPQEVISGANIQRRFLQGGATYSTFFEDNQVMAILEARPSSVLKELSKRLGREPQLVKEDIRRRAAKYISANAQETTVAKKFEAAQGAALELLKGLDNQLGETAGIIWSLLYQDSLKKEAAQEAPADVGDQIERNTFFTELRRPVWRRLREKIWPESAAKYKHEQIREEALRGQLLSTAARLGHAFIDFYVLAIKHLGTLSGKASGGAEEDRNLSAGSLLQSYLNHLGAQMDTTVDNRPWGAFDELAEISSNFDLILDVNVPETREKKLTEAARFFGSLMRQQQPVGGMAGQINKTLVQQFRMPGYPFVLISTDLLQEGEDLHTFCSSMLHYGISWTPSSMEQRIGRIDRVRSQTDRRLSSLEREPTGEDLLQVYFPYLEDSVEILQVQRVLERMNVFLRLMHEGLTAPKEGKSSIDLNQSFQGTKKLVDKISERLCSSFPVPDWAKHGEKKELAIDENRADLAIKRFQGLSKLTLSGLNIEWETRKGSDTSLMGTVIFENGRSQPFVIVVKSEQEFLVVRCISPIGRVDPQDSYATITESIKNKMIRVGAVLTQHAYSYDLTVEDDIILPFDPTHDATRLTMLLQRVAKQADILEQIHLPGQDQPLRTFQEDLQKEGWQE
jgi:hypothetical protein